MAVWLARLTIAGIVLYLILDVIAQLLPPHYSPIHQAESDLAVGRYGYVMTINFVVRGFLSFALLFSLTHELPLRAHSRFGQLALGIWATGAFLLRTGARLPGRLSQLRRTSAADIRGRPAPAPGPNARPGRPATLPR